MSKFAEDNSAFIKTMKELPKVISSIGYDPIDPRLINSRSGVFVTLIALLRLPEVHSTTDVLLFVTSKLGKDLAIDPYELLTPTDYRSVSGARKLEYRMVADTRAYSMVNKLINDSKELNRELINLSHQDDIPVKIERLCEQAIITFKRIVSLKEFSFGGAYLLDEDVYEHLQLFTKDLNEFSMLSTSSAYYRELVDRIKDEAKHVANPAKLESITNEVVKKYFIPAHENAEQLYSHVIKSLEGEKRRTDTLKESIGFIQDFVRNVSNSDADGFDPFVFLLIAENLKGIMDTYDADLESLKIAFIETYERYKGAVHTAIIEKGTINPSHIIEICKKQHSIIERFVKELDRFILFNNENEFRKTQLGIINFYRVLNAKYLDNRSFKDSVGKSFKFKKMLKK